MPLDLSEYNRLKKEVDAARRKADEAVGQAKAVKAQLAELGLKTIEQAEKRQGKLAKEIEGLEQEFNAGVKAYQEKFAK